jgi:hypothetical protein
MAWLCVLDMLLCCRTRLTSGCVGTRAEKAGDCKLSSGRVAHTQVFEDWLSQPTVAAAADAAAAAAAAAPTAADVAAATARQAL